MRGAALLVLTLGFSFPALAAEPAAVPDGWSRADDGTYTHAQSGIVCRPSHGPYSLVRLDGPSEPGILGVCVYSGGPVRIAEIRVRKFIDGAGETTLAIQNDRTLMGLAPAPGVPPGGQLVETFRVGPGPQIDGTATSQVVITTRAGDLMVDCISQTGLDETERGFGLDNFLKGCLPSK